MNWAAVEAIGTILAAVLAITAWRTSQETLRLSYKPVLRPVPTKTPALIKIKNYGIGPAMAAMVVSAAMPETILGEVQVVEPLGERGDTGQANRVGNVLVSLSTNIYAMVGSRYRMFGQDIDRVWHETTFEVTTTGFTIRYLGPKRWWHFRSQVPRAVKTRGHFAAPDELV